MKVSFLLVILFFTHIMGGCITRRFDLAAQDAINHQFHLQLSDLQDNQSRSLIMLGRTENDLREAKHSISTLEKALAISQRQQLDNEDGRVISNQNMKKPESTNPIIADSNKLDYPSSLRISSLEMIEIDETKRNSFKKVNREASKGLSILPAYIKASFSFQPLSTNNGIFKFSPLWKEMDSNDPTMKYFKVLENTIEIYISGLYLVTMNSYKGIISTSENITLERISKAETEKNLTLISSNTSSSDFYVLPAGTMLAVEGNRAVIREGGGRDTDSTEQTMQSHSSISEITIGVAYLNRV